MNAEQLKNLFSRNWQLKLISLALAIMAWYFVMGEEKVEISAPVEVLIELPDNYVAVNGSTQTKYATLRGPRVFLGSLVRQKKLNAVIQTNNPKLGRNRYQLGRSDLQESIDPRVVIDILDPLIDFDVENKSKKTVPLIERLSGSVKEGFTLKKLVWDPPSVEVSGTKSAVAPIKDIEPDAIDVAGKDQGFEMWVDIKAPEGSSVKVRPARVKVAAIITKLEHKKTFQGVMVQPDDCPKRTRVKPSVVSVELEGQKAKVEAVKLKDIRVLASCEGKKTGSFEKRIDVVVDGFEGSNKVRPEFGVLILGE